MSKRFVQLCILCVVLAFPVLGGFDSCNGTSSAPSAPPPGGFTVQVLDTTLSGINAGLDPGAQINGSFVKNICAAGTTNCPMGNVTSFGFVGNGSYISGGIEPAFWQGVFKATCIDPFTEPAGQGWSTNVTGQNVVVTVGSCILGGASGQFFAAGSLPATTTIQTSSLTSASGLPQLSVYSVNKGLLSQNTAVSVAPDGSSATFNFPTNTNGTALGTGGYSFKISNRTSTGTYKPVSGGIISIGSISTAFVSPYGVDAANVTTRTSGASTGSSVQVYPIVTLFDSNQVAYRGRVVSVGVQPSAVKVYANAVTSNTSDCTCRLRSCCIMTIVTEPTRALVANSGSNSVSALAIGGSGPAVTNTIAVGVQPVALLIKGDQTKAYVANLGSGTVSEIDLSTFTQTRTVSVGSSPTSLTLDPGGTTFWIGGLNFIKQVDMSSFAVITSYAVDGQVTSLAISNAQNAFVYTAINSSNTFLAQHSNLTNGASAHTDYSVQVAATSPLLQKGAASTGLPGWVMVNGPLISTNYNNRYIVEGTPTGFLIYDLQSNTQLMQVTTTGTVRGIATDPSQGTVLVTTPSSNSLYTIPLPPLQSN
jgi:YVTN family beta-propeller protein